MPTKDSVVKGARIKIEESKILDEYLEKEGISFGTWLKEQIEMLGIPKTEGMSSSKTKIRTIRIKNETADFFKDKPLNKVVENVYDLAKKKDLEVSENGDILLSSRANA